MTGHFNPRSPRGERPREALPSITSSQFQSTLPARGATATRRRHRRHCHISIHAPREGSDSYSRELVFLKQISIHAPREGSDLPLPRQGRNCKHFNPRSPRGERLTLILYTPAKVYFNPRSPRGERHSLSGMSPEAIFISIHAPREGSDNNQHAIHESGREISIHAPREGSDGYY